MAEWLYESGIGENRAALLEGMEIVEALIELPGEIRAGSVHLARLTHILIPGRRGIVSLGAGGEALIEPLPRTLTEGAALRAEIVREALPERGRNKLPKCRETEADERPGPTLLERIGASGIPVVTPGPHSLDRLEEAGWSQLLEEARTGEMSFEGGALRVSLSPAMTLIDVDGPLDPRALAIAGAAAAGRAIRQLGIGGSIGIDLPTLAAKDDRQAAAGALDAALPMPFERTAVNGFGFLQIVRRRERASLPELVQGDPAGVAARLLLRQAQRAPGGGERLIQAAAPVIARLQQNPAWLQELERHLGAAVRLREEPTLAIFSGHVQSQFQ